MTHSDSNQIIDIKLNVKFPRHSQMKLCNKDIWHDELYETE